MLIDGDRCYRAMVTHDARFDGRFFVGVSSTRVYCRPVCTVKLPKRENCTFYPSAAAAEQAGFRPCLRCRPELAPGSASVDASRRLAQSAASLIEDGGLTDSRLDDLAAQLGVTSRHLRRVFAAEFGVSPIEYAQTQRLLLAKRLLTDTSMPVTDVAMAAGFGSVRRFNTLFSTRYRMKPAALRKSPESVPQPVLTFELVYRPPYAWDEHMRFLEHRAIAGVEAVIDGDYCRSVRVRRGDRWYTGWLRAAPVPSRRCVRVTLSGSLAGVVPLVLGRVKHLFDLDCRPDEVAAQLESLARPGLRLPGAFDGFEMAVRAILGQQVTVRAARTLASRVAHALGARTETPFNEIDTTFPDSVTLASAKSAALGRLGITSARVRAIQALARMCAEGGLRLDPSCDVERTLELLRGLPGIGEWTAQYIAMRALHWPDAFPSGDYGVKKALNESSEKRVLAIAERWRPWRAYATMSLWQSLGKQGVKR